MPRPGPRPYECVRRAWHSDRHQPMKGSIIQQIFRVVHERHSPATKKNKEWREKLPIVVLKAEEIMYSKANSEAEYMDPETLWDRVNDAINTIIRIDVSAETGDLLLPCVEAALNLGCVPVRASRSQRNANLRSYLCPRSQEPGCVHPKVLDGTTNEQNPQLPPLHSGNQLSRARPVAVNLTHSVTESNRHVTLNNNPSNYRNFSLPRAEVPPSSNSQFIPVENRTSASVGAVYPLYYGTKFQSEMPHLGFQLPGNSNAIIVGPPNSQAVAEPAQTGCLQNLFSQSASNRVSQADFRNNHIKSPETGCLQNLFSRERYGSASNEDSQADFKNNHEKAPETGFDLSLRLGLFKDPCTSLERVLVHDTDNVDLSSSQEGSKFGNQSPHQNKEFSFFPVETANDPLRFSERWWNSKGEDQYAEATVRKRKASFNNNTEEVVFFSQPEFRSNQFTGQMKRPGL